MSAPRSRALAFACGLAAAALATATAPAWSAEAKAGGEPQKSAETLTRAGSLTEKVTVVSFDPATRQLAIKRENGETETLKVPAELHNVQNLKPGDVIRATYKLEAAVTLTPFGKAAPASSQSMLTARAPKGKLPTGLATSHTVLTGAVVSVDTSAHTVRLVNPSGGQVHTIYVPSAEGRAMLAKVKPGDKVTAEVSESLLISTERS